MFLLLGARPWKCKTSDRNLLKDEHRWKKAKIKSTMPPGMQVVDLDALTSPTTPNPPSTSTTPPPDLSMSTSMEGQWTDACDTAPKESTPSPSDHALHPFAIAPPACICTTSPWPAPSPPMPLPCVPESTPAVPTMSTPQPPSGHVPIQGMLILQVNLCNWCITITRTFITFPLRR